jgi:hypothetical protein
MPTPSEMRDEPRLLREAADEEIHHPTKQKLAARAVELALLAEQIERQERNS